MEKANFSPVVENTSRPQIKRINKIQLSIIMALVAILPISALMIAMLRSNYNATLASNNIQSNVSTNDSNNAYDTDYTGLAYKYFDRFVFGQDGTIRLNLDTKQRSLGEIEEQDIQDMQEYAQMLDSIAYLVLDGILTENKNGDYVLVDITSSQTLTRGANGGRSDFYIKRGWFSIPVGYHFELPTLGSIVFGAITGLAGLAGLVGGVILKGSKAVADWIKVTAGVANVAAAAWVDANVDWIYGILFGIYATGLAIDAVLTASTAGLGAAVAIIIRTAIFIVGTHIFNTIGIRFLVQGIANIFRDHNTVVVESNLLLLNVSHWTYKA